MKRKYLLSFIIFLVIFIVFLVVVFKQIVVDKTSPEVSIKSPVEGSYVSGEVEIEVEATDANLRKVELYVNSTKVSEKTTAPYTFSLDTTKYSRGKNEIKAVAYDNSGNKGEAKISVYISNEPEGELKWKYKTDESIFSSPATGSDGTIYVGSRDNYLYAINPNGTLKWKFYTNGFINSSPAIGNDGTIYVGSWDSYLYAIYTFSFGLAESPWPKFRRNMRNTGNAEDTLQ